MGPQYNTNRYHISLMCFVFDKLLSHNYHSFLFQILIQFKELAKLGFGTKSYNLLKIGTQINVKCHQAKFLLFN